MNRPTRPGNRSRPHVHLDADTLSVLFDYRTAARKAVRGTGERWTALLSQDWLRAGPHVSGFSRDRWPLLQRLRNNHGPAILPELDRLIDEWATAQTAAAEWSAKPVEAK